MAVPAWPLTLPQRSEREGYSETVADGLLRTPMDTGPAKVRRRAGGVRQLSMAFLMTTAQVAAFKSFYNDDLAGGANPFTIPSPHGGTWLVMLAEPLPAFTSVGPIWRVVVNMEILP